MLVVDLQTQQAVEYLIRNLEKFEQNKALREGLSGAAKIFYTLGRRNLLSSSTGIKSGALLSSITSRVRVNRKTGEPTVVGFERPRGNLAHLVDLGSGPRYTESGAYRGIMPANYFFTAARVEGEKPATDAIIDGIQRAINRINSGR